MVVTLIVPDNYGYAAIVALGVIPVLAWAQGSVVTALRKPAQVPYPNAYATAEEVKTSKEAYKFNCAQRAHGNLLENMPQAMATILFSGLFYPNAAAGLGVGWVVCRALYAYGYISSDKPNGRGRSIGGGSWLMQAGLWGCSLAGALKLI